MLNITMKQAKIEALNIVSKIEGRKVATMGELNDRSLALTYKLHGEDAVVKEYNEMLVKLGSKI